MRLTTEEFIRRAREIHGDKYDYSNVVYLGTKTKVCIYCLIHKECFWQTPDVHLRGCECPKCGRMRANEVNSLGKEEFVNKANEKHNYKYDYSLVEYINNKTKVKIICPLNGVFEKAPCDHLLGSGHPKESLIKRNKNKTYTTEEFIEKARKVHGDKYEYSKVDYRGYSEKVLIYCKINGYFWQKPCYHLAGSGHPNFRKLNAKTIKLNTVIDRFKKAHGDFYDYSKVEYTNSHTDVCIIDPELGEFFQSPTSHWNGCNHPKRAQTISKSEIEIQGILKDMGYEIISNSRKTIYPKELDIYIPDLNKAIEFNGTYWHYTYNNPNCKPKGYHAEKSNLCRAKGIKLLHVREELWLRDKEKMKEIIKTFLNL